MPSNYSQGIEQLVEMEPGYGLEGGKWEVIVRHNGDIQKIETDLGAEVELLGDGFAIITLLRNRIPLLYHYREIEYIELPRTLTLTLDQSIEATCVADVHGPGRYRLTGKGTLIGVIDSGIDYTHPDFRNRDGTSRILYIWDQTEDGLPPDGFKHGTEYNNYRLNMALNGRQPFESAAPADTLGHGTAVAGIAAGNGRSGGGRETGVAPEASLIVVKLGYRGFESFARTTEIMRALKYILDKAESLDMPVAINISYGTNDGSHDGSSLFETYIDAAAQRWKTVIAVASGNEGAAGHHFSGEIKASQTIDAGFVVAEKLDSLYLTFWKSFVDRLSLELILPDGNTTGILEPSERVAFRNGSGVSIRVYYGQPTHYNEDQEVYFLIRGQASSIPQGYWRLRVRGEDIVVGKFDIWLPTTEEAGTGVAFTNPSVNTTLTIPSTAKNVLSAGGYNGATGAAAPFSGRGFVRGGGYVKPDLAAPAAGIISTRAGGGYDSFTGTSMAAPFLAGASALMMQWGIVQGNDPFLYGQRVKAFLKKGAKRTSAADYPNPVWGYGTLCLRNSMDFL